MVRALLIHKNSFICRNMEKLTFYTAPICPFSQRVAIAIKEVVDSAVFQTEWKDIDLQNKSPEFLSVNPRGKVPTLVIQTDPPVIMTGSMVIVEYLLERFAEETM
jgi:glutathione S-transferase